jgi:hypothetical protein
MRCSTWSIHVVCDKRFPHEEAGIVACFARISNCPQVSPQGIGFVHRWWALRLAPGAGRLFRYIRDHSPPTFEGAL